MRACQTRTRAIITIKLPKVLRFRFFLYICAIMKDYGNRNSDIFDEFKDYKPTIIKRGNTGDFIDYFYAPIIIIVVVAICILLQCHYGVKII